MININYRSKGTGGKYSKDRNIRTVSYKNLLKKPNMGLKFKKTVKKALKIFSKKGHMKRKKILSKAKTFVKKD